MNDQDLIRERVNLYIKTEGVSAKHIAIKCNIPQDVFSRFRNMNIKKDLYEESLKVLEEYLIEHNA